VAVHGRRRRCTIRKLSISYFLQRVRARASAPLLSRLCASSSFPLSLVPAPSLALAALALASLQSAHIDRARRRSRRRRCTADRDDLEGQVAARAGGARTLARARSSTAIPTAAAVPLEEGDRLRSSPATRRSLCNELRGSVARRSRASGAAASEAHRNPGAPLRTDRGVSR